MPNQKALPWASNDHPMLELAHVFCTLVHPWHATHYYTSHVQEFVWGRPCWCCVVSSYISCLWQDTTPWASMAIQRNEPIYIDVAIARELAYLSFFLIGFVNKFLIIHQVLVLNIF